MPLFKSKSRMSETGNGEVRFQVDCKYIGSQAIDVMKKSDYQRTVDEILNEIKDNVRGVPVVFVISTEGNKTYDKSGKTVKLAHAITKIASSTCNPEGRLFAYVARAWQSNGILNMQAHIFRTKKTSHAQQLGTFASRAFRLAVSRATAVRDQAAISFETETATEEMEKPHQVARKRWAKKELAKGHDYSEHANRARASNGALISQVWQDDASFHDGLTSHSSPPSSPLAVAPADQSLHSKTSAENLEDHYAALQNPTGGTSIMSPTDQSDSSPVNSQIKAVENLFILSTSVESCSAPADFTVDQPTDIVVDGKIIDKEFTLNSNHNQYEYQPLNKPQKGAMDINRYETVIYSNDIATHSLSPSNSQSDEDNGQSEICGTDNNIHKATHLSSSSPSNSQSDEENGQNEICETEDNRYKATHSSPPSNSQSDEENGQDEFGETEDKIRTISYIIPEEDLLDASHWFQEGLTRELCEEALALSSAGSFLVRASQSNPGGYGMSLCCQSVPDFLVRNFLITRLDDQRYQIRGCTAAFDTLTSLIAHYASSRDELPIELSLGESNPLFFERQVLEETENDVNKNKRKQVQLYYEGDDPDYSHYSNSETIMKELLRCVSTK